MSTLRSPACRGPVCLAPRMFGWVGLGRAVHIGDGSMVVTPCGVIRPMALGASSMNHRLPSGPATRAPGMLFLVGRANSVAHGYREHSASPDARGIRAVPVEKRSVQELLRNKPRRFIRQHIGRLSVSRTFMCRGCVEVPIVGKVKACPRKG
jgi:hypothetical protein